MKLFKSINLYYTELYLKLLSRLLPDTNIQLAHPPRGREDSNEAEEDGEGFAETGEEWVGVCYLVPSMLALH